MRSRLCEDSTFGMAFEGSHPIDLAIVSDRADLDLNSPRDLAAFHLPVFSVPGEPLTRLTYGRIGSGSALAINISHCVADGYSFFMFAGARGRSAARYFLYLLQQLLISVSTGFLTILVTSTRFPYISITHCIY